MKFVRIETDNFLNINSGSSSTFSTNIPPDIALFIGKNGCGKSILLEQIAHSVQGGLSNPIQQLRQAMDNYGNTFKSTSVTAHFDFGQHTVKFERTTQNQIDSRNSFSGHPQGMCVYVPASRDFSKDNDKSLRDMDFPYGQRLSIFDRNQENNFEKILVSLSSKEIQASYHKFSSTKETATLQRIRSAYKIIFPSIELLGAYGSVFLAKKNNSSFPISFLSHGEKQALILFTTLAKEPTLDESIVIIDEPEIGLSKEIRVNLASALRNLSPSLQIIIATHSKEIIESVDPSKIVPLT